MGKPTSDLAIALKRWLDSPKSATCRDTGTLKAPPSSGQYLENRLRLAFLAGWDAAEKALAEAGEGDVRG